MLAVLTLFLLLFLAPEYAASDPPVSERIRDAARETLEVRFPEEAHRLQIRVIRTGGALPGEEQLKVTFQEPEVLPHAHAKVDVWKETRGDWTRAGWALLYVSHFDSVVVARARFSKGDRIAPEDVTFAWVDVTGFRGQPLHPAEYRSLAGGEVFAARPLQERRPLRSGDLRPPFAADTGDVVRMHYRRGVIRLQVPCRAREPGFTGDLIRIYNTDTDTMYRARLTAPGEAEWVSTIK